MKDIYIIVSLFLLCSCKSTQNETSLFVDLPLEKLDEKKQAVEVEVVREYATVVKQAKMNAEPANEDAYKELLPGERVMLLGDTVYIPQLGVVFLKVRNQYDEEGWVRENVVILDIKIGVVIRNTEVFEKPDVFSNRAKMLRYGEIVRVKQSHLKNWFTISKKGDESNYWINNLSFLSFEGVDIALAQARKDILFELPKPEAIQQLKEVVGDTSNALSVFYNELYDSLYENTEDHIVF